MSPADIQINRVCKRGFGLIELLVAIAVVAVLMAVGIPSFTEVGRRMTVSSNANNMVTALNQAKAEAAKLGVMVGVVGSTNNWTANGWSVLADSNHDNTLTGADTTIAQYPALTAGYTVTTKVTGGADAQIVFGPQGALSPPATSADVNVCRPDSQPAQSLWVHVAASGEITSHKNTTGSPAPGC
jgi:type IV fimbrial biogenesis protein FimT